MIEGEKLNARQLCSDLRLNSFKKIMSSKSRKSFKDNIKKKSTKQMSTVTYNEPAPLSASIIKKESSGMVLPSQMKSRN